MVDKYGYVYLMKVREFINTDIIKIGMTSNYKKRLSGYPKGSYYIKYTKILNYKYIEKILIRIFNNKFIKKNKYGNEYFKGDLNDIILTFDTIVNIHKYIIFEFNKKNNNKTINNLNNIINKNIINKNNNKTIINKNDNKTIINKNDNKTIINKTIINKTIIINNNYKCIKCSYKTNSKYSFNRHLNRKNPCDNKNIIVCEYCNKQFTHINNYYTHKKHKCEKLKEINNNETNNNEINNNEINNNKINKLEEELKKRELELKIKKIELEIKNINSKINKIYINQIKNTYNKI